MAIKCILENRRVDQILDVVKELRAAGLVQSKDFDFRWEPAHYDWSGDAECGSRATFTFYTEQYATMFELKYQ